MTLELGDFFPVATKLSKSQNPICISLSLAPPGLLCSLRRLHWSVIVRL